MQGFSAVPDFWQGGGESAGAGTLSSQGSWGPGIPRIPWASLDSLWIFSPELGTTFHQVSGSSCRGSGTSTFSQSSLDAMGLLKTSVLPSDCRNVLDTVVWNLWGDGSVLLWENQSREEDPFNEEGSFSYFYDKCSFALHDSKDSGQFPGSNLTDFWTPEDEPFLYPID